MGCTSRPPRRWAALLSLNSGSRFACSAALEGQMAQQRSAGLIRLPLLPRLALLQVKKYTLNLTDLEIKVEEATNSETWGEAHPAPAAWSQLWKLLVAAQPPLRWRGWQPVMHYAVYAAKNAPHSCTFPAALGLVPVPAGPHGSVMNGERPGRGSAASAALPLGAAAQPVVAATPS